MFGATVLIVNPSTFFAVYTILGCLFEFAHTSFGMFSYLHSLNFSPHVHNFTSLYAQLCPSLNKVKFGVWGNILCVPVFSAYAITFKVLMTTALAILVHIGLIRFMSYMRVSDSSLDCSKRLDVLKYGS